MEVLANFATDKYGLDCGLELKTKVFQLSNNNNNNNNNNIIITLLLLLLLLLVVEEQFLCVSLLSFCFLFFHMKVNKFSFHHKNNIFAWDVQI